MSLLRSSLAVYTATVIGYLFSVLSQIVVAMHYGAGQEIDVFYGAQTLPVLVRVVFTSCSIFILVPLFIEYREKLGERQARERTGEILITLLLGMIAINILDCFFAERLLRLICPGFTQADLSLGVRILYWESVSTVMMGVALLATSMHHIDKSFALPSLAAMFPTIGIVIGSHYLSADHGIFGLVIGETAGSFVWMSLLLAKVLRRDAVALPRSLFTGDAMKAYLLMAPFVLFAFFQNFNPLVERYFASGLGQGKIAYLGYSSRLSTVLSSIFSSGIAVVLHPVISSAAAKKDLDGFKRYFSISIRFVAVLSIPVILISMPACLNVVQFIFERGRFTVADSANMTSIMPFYLLAAGLMALGQVIGRGFYSLKDTWTPLWLGLLGAVIYTVFTAVLSVLLGYRGVAISFLVYWAYIVGGLGVFLSRRLGSHWKGFAMLSLKTSIAALPALFGNYVSIKALGLVGIWGLISTSIWIMAFFAVAFHYTKIEEISELRRRVMGRLSRMPAR